MRLKGASIKERQIRFEKRAKPKRCKGVVQDGRVLGRLPQLSEYPA